MDEEPYVGLIYIPSDHFWFVSGDETRVFSSAAGEYVAVDDSAFTEWLSPIKQPSRILNEAELIEVLENAGVNPGSLKGTDR